MSELTPCDVEETLAYLESAISASRDVGITLPPPVVEAIDVVYHALIFTSHPRALELWRAAVHDNTMAPEARDAVTSMLVHLNDAVGRGEDHRITEICDCLEHLMGPDARSR